MRMYCIKISEICLSLVTESLKASEDVCVGDVHAAALECVCGNDDDAMEHSKAIIYISSLK